ncbi:hypothetical protein [Staphylococcus xylosus]|uniref:hypothetical protein n=2 Tax=Staphylococcus xylosus TaxID=1288 RepID=UPI003F54EDB4
MLKINITQIFHEFVFELNKIEEFKSLNEQYSDLKNTLSKEAFELMDILMNQYEFANFHLFTYIKWNIDKFPNKFISENQKSEILHGVKDIAGISETIASSFQNEIISFSKEIPSLNKTILTQNFDLLNKMQILFYYFLKIVDFSKIFTDEGRKKYEELHIKDFIVEIPDNVLKFRNDKLIKKYAKGFEDKKFMCEVLKFNFYSKIIPIVIFQYTFNKIVTLDKDNIIQTSEKHLGELKLSKMKLKKFVFINETFIELDDGNIGLILKVKGYPYDDVTIIWVLSLDTKHIVFNF